MPPMVILDRKNRPPELAVGEVPETIYRLSSKGCIVEELFDFQQALSSLTPDCPLLLLLDGHSSHYCSSTMQYAAEEKVIIFSVPPYTTYLM